MKPFADIQELHNELIYLYRSWPHTLNIKFQLGLVCQMMRNTCNSVSNPFYQNTKYRMQNTKYKIQNEKYRIQNTKYKIQNTIQMMVGRQMQLACARVPLINQSVEEKTGRSHKSSNRHHHIDDQNLDKSKSFDTLILF